MPTPEQAPQQGQPQPQLRSQTPSSSAKASRTNYRWTLTCTGPRQGEYEFRTKILITTLQAFKTAYPGRFSHGPKRPLDWELALNYWPSDLAPKPTVAQAKTKWKAALKELAAFEWCMQQIESSGHAPLKMSFGEYFIKYYEPLHPTNKSEWMEKLQLWRPLWVIEVPLSVMDSHLGAKKYDRAFSSRCKPLLDEDGFRQLQQLVAVDQSNGAANDAANHTPDSSQSSFQRSKSCTQQLPLHGVARGIMCQQHPLHASYIRRLCVAQCG
eukprot:m.187122 g.187122  ORF g.187122 m.187122 type:complete len:269 (+) comp14768_c0_seq1:101-907(+)